MDYTIRNQTTNRLYSIWVEFRRRCRNPRTEKYLIKELEYHHEWDDYLVFMEWALSNGYRENLSLDRIDNSLGYTPSNCTFSTKQEQQYNRDKRDNKKYSSKYLGVSRLKPSKRMTSPLKKEWRARVQSKGKEIYCECFETELEAAKARDKYCVDNSINVVLNFNNI